MMMTISLQSLELINSSQKNNYLQSVVSEKEIII